jgi:hypothetical protein
MWIDRDGFERDGTRDAALALQPAQSRFGEYRLVIEPPGDGTQHWGRAGRWQAAGDDW